LGDSLYLRVHSQIQAHDILLWALTGQDCGLLAAAATRIDHPLARLERTAALELLLHPANVNIIVESVAAFALEASVPARQPLDGVAPADLGNVVGHVAEQPRNTFGNGIALPARSAAQGALEDADLIFLLRFGQFDWATAFGTRQQIDERSSHRVALL